MTWAPFLGGSLGPSRTWAQHEALESGQLRLHLGVQVNTEVRVRPSTPPASSCQGPSHTFVLWDTQGTQELSGEATDVAQFFLTLRASPDQPQASSPAQQTRAGQSTRRGPAPHSPANFPKTSHAAALGSLSPAPGSITGHSDAGDSRGPAPSSYPVGVPSPGLASAPPPGPALH